MLFSINNIEYRAVSGSRNAQKVLAFVNLDNT